MKWPRLGLVFLLFFGCVFLGLILPHKISAADCENFACKKESDNYESCLNDKQACLETAIANTKKQSQTLSGDISILNGKIQVQQIQISQTIAQIDKLEKEIQDLSTRISGLEISLDKLSQVLAQRVRNSYKLSTTHNWINLINDPSISDVIRQIKYLETTQANIGNAMKKAEEQKINYDEQKNLKETKQTEIEAKKKLLENQKKELTGQISQKQNLLAVTKNDEKRYQQLLAEARAEVASFKNFAVSKGGGSVPPQNSPDGWYFSQRDERWAGYRIGSSSEVMLDVGCLVSSVAMIRKKFGEDVNPVTIAANSSLFFSNTALMLKPWSAPNGYHFSESSYSQSKLDEELQKNPVIVKLLAGSYGSHFIVIKEKKDNQYIMHDPWEGYDKKFSDFYSTSQINRIDYLVKN